MYLSICRGFLCISTGLLLCSYDMDYMSGVGSGIDMVRKLK